MAGNKDDDAMRARMTQLGNAWQNPSRAQSIRDMVHAVQSGDLARAKKMAEQCHLSVQQLHDVLFPEIQRIFDRLDRGQKEIVASVQQLCDQATAMQVKTESVAENSQAMRSVLETMKQYADLGTTTRRTPEGALCAALGRSTHAQKATFESLRALTADQIEMARLLSHGDLGQPTDPQVTATGPGAHAAAQSSNSFRDTEKRQHRPSQAKVTMRPQNPRGVRACLRLTERYSARYKTHQPPDELDFIWAFIENQHIMVARLVQKALLQRYPRLVTARTRSGPAHPATGVRPLIHIDARITWPQVEGTVRELKFTSVRAQLCKEEEEKEEKEKQQQHGKATDGLESL